MILTVPNCARRQHRRVPGLWRLHQAVQSQRSQACGAPARVIMPVDSVHRIVLIAIERGMLPNLIFDNQALVSHRVMAAILGSILRLPPIQQALASEQMRSRYLVKLLEWGQESICRTVSVRAISEPSQLSELSGQPWLNTTGWPAPSPCKQRLQSGRR